MSGMKGRKKVDLSGLKCLVIDEADFFFADERNFLQMQDFHK
jgi:superfamily II DNA/RNA helicase